MPSKVKLGLLGLPILVVILLAATGLLGGRHKDTPPGRPAVSGGPASSAPGVLTDSVGPQPQR